MKKPASRIVKQWFSKASENLRLAKSILELDEKFYEHVCFNAQQCAEKAIKGYLNYHRIRFDKVHDIAVLVKLAIAVDPTLDEYLKPADALTKFAVRIRYPEEAGDALVVDKRLAQHSIELAEKAYTVLSTVL